MDLLVLGGLELYVKRIGATFLEEKYARFRLFRRKTVILIADKTAETEALDVAEAVSALFIYASKGSRLPILFLIVANDRQKIPVDEYLFLGLSLFEPPVLPDKDEFIKRRTLEKLVAIPETRTDEVVLLVPFDRQLAGRNRPYVHLLESSGFDLRASRILLRVLLYQPLEIFDDERTQMFDVVALISTTEHCCSTQT